MNREYYVVFVLPAGLFFCFFLAVARMVYMSCLVYMAFVSEGAVCTQHA